MSDAVEPIYSGLAFQARCVAINSIDSPADAQERMATTLERLGRQLAMIKQIGGEALKLVVLPEYFLTGFPMAESIADWRAKAALEPGGREYGALAEIAVKNAIYLSGNAYEADAAFPELYFQTCFVIDPQGRFCLRYRRLISLYGPTPIDVWDQYLDVYGEESVFPVARTPIGNLAAIASEEILYPEIARCHAMRGAEVFLHNSAEFASPRATPKELCRMARAVENMAYVVSANSASLEGTDIPMATTDAMSKIIDYNGRVLAEAGYGETMAAMAEIDLVALRRYRGRPGMFNLLSRPPYEVFAAQYARASAAPLNAMLGVDGVTVPARAALQARQEKVIRRLQTTGLL